MAASCAALRWSALLCSVCHCMWQANVKLISSSGSWHFMWLPGTDTHLGSAWAECRGRATLNDSQNSEWLIMQFGSEPFGLMRSLSLSFMHSFTHSLHLFLTADASVNSNAAGPPLWGASDKQTGTGSRSESQSGRSRQKEKKKKRSKSKRSRSSCK